MSLSRFTRFVILIGIASRKWDVDELIDEKFKFGAKNVGRRDWNNNYENVNVNKSFLLADVKMEFEGIFLLALSHLQLFTMCEEGSLII